MSEQTLKILAIIIFAVTYIALLIFSKFRAYIAFGSAVLFLILGILPVKLFLQTVNWNLLLMLAGIMGTVSLFIDSKMPAVLGDAIISKSPDLKWAIIILALFSGIISAFIDNVATVLIMAPIAIDIAKKTGTSPVPSIIAIAIMSNLQGAATLVGDTTSILLGAQAEMNFFDFFVFKGKPGLFFVIQASMLLAAVYLIFVFRKHKQKISVEEKEKATSIFPTVLLLITIALLIAASFIQDKLNFEYTNGVICVAVFFAGLIWTAVKNKNNYKKQLFQTLKGIDFLTLLLIGSLFVIIGGIKNVGIIDDLAKLFTSLSSNLFLIYTIVVLASVLLSAFIDNIPYVAAMLPVAAGISQALGIEPYLLYFGLISGATLGGNLTPIGASANITALGILRKEGYKVSIGQFMKISVPFTLIAVLSGYAMIWFIWA